MKRTLTVVALALAVVPASAQEPPQLLPDIQQAPPPAAPVRAQPAPPGSIQVTPEKLQRIYHIRQLEGILTNAVKAGASTLAYQMQVAEPSLFVTTNARTRGFELEGYGVFFDVDVPAMLQSAVWSAQVRQEQMQYLERLRAAVADMKVDPAIRRMAQIELDKAQRFGLIPSQMVPPIAAPQPAGQGMVTGQVTDAPPTTDTRLTPPPTVAPLPDPRDPNERYTDAIKEKLIDAMLAYVPTALRLDDQEWLVIAARATSDNMPGQLDDSASILLRIKGEDLNAYVLKKLSREEVIKKIEIKIG